MIHWKHRRSAFSSNQWGIFEEKYLLLKSSVYTGNILSCVKPCAGVKWFRTSKRCVYVYERWLGLTNVARCVCQFYCDGGRAPFVLYSVAHVTHQEDAFFQVDTVCVYTCMPSYYYFKYVVTKHSDSRLLHQDSRSLFTINS